MEQLLIAIFGAALLTLIYRSYRIPITHRWRRRQARTMCEQLCGRDRDQPAALHYARLRAMDPLAFEELLLEAFERRGHRVIRNRRYTGDGGVDGEVIIDGQHWLIQAKRYRDAIKPEHVREFAMLCATRKRRGMFVHTGRIVKKYIITLWSNKCSSRSKFSISILIEPGTGNNAFVIDGLKLKNSFLRRI